MKKLIIVLGIAMAACSLQASSYIWGFGNAETVAVDGKYFGEGAYADASAFLYLGTVALVDGAFNFGDAQLLASSQGMDAELFNWGDFNPPGSNNSALVNAAGGQDYTLILVDQGGLTTLDGFEGHAIVATGTSRRDSLPGAGATTYYANFVNDAQYGAADWQNVASIPEPTSGLLLLLGMAGLALRRRCA